MLPKRFQVNLRAHSDFFRQCKKKHSPEYSLYYRTVDQVQGTIIVPKKYARLAVQRNSVKRKYRAALATVFTSGYFERKLVIIIVHKPGLSTTVAQIVDSLKQHAKQIS